MIESPTEHRFIRSSVLIITVITIASLLPFITKAFNVDDPLFLWTAQQIQINPLDFYGFKVNWDGIEADMSSINKNPPLVSYYIALVTSLFGWKETVIHAFFIIPAVALSVGIYFLARSFCSSPCLAAILAIFNPVFLVSSTSVMTDITMVAFYVWAIFLWREGLKNERAAYLFISAIFITLSSLTKYFGLTLIPLLFVFTLAERRKFDSKACFLFIPILLFAGYDWLNYNLYNHSLLSEAVIYSLEQKKAVASFGILDQTLIGLAFTGGCLLGLNFFLPMLYRRNFFLMATVLLILLVYVLSSIESIGYYKLYDEIKSLGYTTEVRWGLVVQIALFGLCGLHILILAISDLIRNKDASALLLFMWIFGTFIFYCYVNWTTSARNILPILPAASIVVIRRINFYLKEPQTSFRLQFLWPLLPAAFISFLVAYADASWANSQRSAAQTINQKFADHKSDVMFQGHWGFQYYMESLGYKPIDVKKTFEGSIMIYPLNNHIHKYPLEVGLFIQTDKVQKQIPSLLSVMKWGQSGWYSSYWGPLPFTLEKTLHEDYIVYSLPSASQHLDLGNMFFSEKKFKIAISHYKEAVKIKPQYVAAHNNLGNALVQEGKFKEAITHYRKALSISPDLIEARKNLELAIRMHREAGETK